MDHKQTLAIIAVSLLAFSCSGDGGEATATTGAQVVAPESVPVTPELAGDCVMLREVFGTATSDASIENGEPPPIEVGDVPDDAQLAVVQAGSDALDTIDFESPDIARAVEDLKASAETVLQKGADGDAVTQEDLDANVQANLNLGQMCAEVLAPESTPPSTDP